MQSDSGSVAKGPLWLRFHIWFFMLTAVYWTFAYNGLAYYVGTFSDSSASATGPHGGIFVGNLIGMFVPIGPSNIILMALPGMWIGIALVAFFVVRGERMLSASNDEPWAKIFLNLLTLLLLTLAVDFLSRGYWGSLSILLGQDK